MNFQKIVTFFEIRAQADIAQGRRKFQDISQLYSNYKKYLLSYSSLQASTSYSTTARRHCCENKIRSDKEASRFSTTS